MMDKGSTLYDYTRSAEELRVFELGETCSRIIHEYEMFNLQNDVYKMFGEWLLNEAKTKYSAKFTSFDLLDYIESKELSRPRSFDIEAEYKDRNDCKPFRMLSDGHRFDSSRPFKSDYGRYTLWKIAQAYNCKNGCVVTEIDPGSKIFLDWSKEAQDCITRERWRCDADCPLIVLLIAGACAGFLLWCVLWNVLNRFVPALCNTFLVREPRPTMFLTTVIVVLLDKFRNTKHRMNKLAWDFDTHCKNIEDARGSRYSIENDRVTY